MTYDMNDLTTVDFNVADAVPYADGEVVAKTIMKSGKLDVRVLALDSGKDIPTHHVDADVLALVLEGRIDFNVDGASTVLKKDDYITMEPNTPHSLHALERSKFLLIRNFKTEKH